MGDFIGRESYSLSRELSQELNFFVEKNRRNWSSKAIKSSVGNYKIFSRILHVKIHPPQTLTHR